MIELPGGSWWDWDVLHFDGSQLRLAAGHDLTYHHGLEVIFTDVACMACPTPVLGSSVPRTHPRRARTGA